MMNEAHITQKKQPMRMKEAHITQQKQPTRMNERLTSLSRTQQNSPHTLTPSPTDANTPLPLPRTMCALLLLVLLPLVLLLALLLRALLLSWLLAKLLWLKRLDLEVGLVVVSSNKKPSLLVLPADTAAGW